MSYRVACAGAVSIRRVACARWGAGVLEAMDYGCPGDVRHCLARAWAKSTTVEP